MSNNDGVWRTVGGRRIFIKNGQDLATAMKESGKFINNENNTKIRSNIRKPEDVTKEELEDIKKLSQLINENGLKAGIEKAVFDKYGLNQKFPKAVSKEEFDKIDTDIIYRGISANSGEQAQSYFDQFMTGDIYNGRNNSGSGVWFSKNENIAVGYKNGEMGTSAKNGKNSFIIKAKIEKDANLINKKDLLSKKERMLMYGVQNDNILSKIVYDDGLYAAILGYDGIIDEIGFTIKVKNVSILNRDILVVENDNK